MPCPMWASERAKRSMILHKTGSVLGEVTPTASFISSGVGFKNQTHLWASHQNSKKRIRRFYCFVLRVQHYGKITEAARRPSCHQLSGTWWGGGQVVVDSVSVPSLWVPTYCSGSLGKPAGHGQTPDPWPAVIQHEYLSTSELGGVIRCSQKPVLNAGEALV